MYDMANESKFLCYLDILGFKNRITEDGFKRCYESIIMSAANSIKELKKCLYEVKALLSKYPNHSEMRLLKDQI